LQRAGTGETELREGARGGFEEGKRMPGDESSGCMIGRFILATDFDGNAAERPGDLPGGAEGGAVAFDGEDYAIEARRSAAAESLHGVERACRGAAAGEWGEDGAVKCATGVEGYLRVDAICAEVRERSRDFFERAIGGGDENYVGIERLGRDHRERSAGADRANRGARSFLRLRHDGADAPPELAETLGESLPYASGTDDGNSARHRA